MTRSAGRNQDQSLPWVSPGRATQENHPLDLSYLGGYLLLSLNIPFFFLLNILISISCDLIASCQVSAVLSLKF